MDEWRPYYPIPQNHTTTFFYSSSDLSTLLAQSFSSTTKYSKSSSLRNDDAFDIPNHAQLESTDDDDDDDDDEIRPTSSVTQTNRRTSSLDSNDDDYLSISSDHHSEDGNTDVEEMHEGGEAIHAAESPPPSPPQNQPEDNHHDYVNEHGEGDNFPGEDGAASGGIRTPATPHEADKQDDDGDVDDVDNVELTSKKKDGISRKSFPPTTKATVSVRLKHFNRPRTLIRDIKKAPSSASSARKKDKTEEASSLPRTSTKSSKPSLRKSSAATLHYLRSNPKPKTKQES